MDGILKALGFDSKPEYQDKIPDTLTEDCFNVHNTFKHGFSSHPLSLGYDSAQQLLAIGAEHGAVLLLGKPGLERHINHPTDAAVTHLVFITNRGLLVTACDNNTLYLWSLKDKQPKILHSLELISEKATALSYVFASDWMYVGTDAGNVHLLHLHTFKISGFTIHWNNAVELSCRRKPGDVISVTEHPLDQGKVLIAFSGGKCVLYDMREAGSHDQHTHHKRFNYDPGSDHILTSVSWLGSGKSFACSYSDGTIAVWNPKVEARPEKVFPLHDFDSTEFKPIYRLQQVHTESDPWMIASGGYPEGNDQAPRTLTLLRGKASTRMLSTESTILDFLCLPSSPRATDCQRPFALVILTKQELVVHDLEHSELPRYPGYMFPYALDIHLPPVTSLHYTANCSDEFIASLHSVKSKLMKVSAKPWPLKGGKWGQEVPHTSTDLIVTGHVDGSVRLWYSSSVILQPFFTMSTSQYFKMRYQPSPKSTPSLNSSPRSTKGTPSSKDTPSSDSASRSIKSDSSGSPSPTKKPRQKAATPPAAMLSTIPPHTQPPSRQTSCPEPLPIPLPPSPEVVETIPEEEEGGALYPATGQEHTITDTTDGANTSGAVERLKVNSFERKSIFKKKKRSNGDGSPQSSRGPSPSPDEGEAVKDKKKKKSSLSKSFKKMAKAVKIGRSLSRERDKPTEEFDGDLSSNASTGGSKGGEEDEGGNKDGVEVASSPSKRPETIPLQPLGLAPIIQEPSSANQTPGSSPTKQPSPAKATPPTTTPPVKVTPPAEAAHPVATPTSSSDEFFPISAVHVCAVGLWMCVANTGGAVMAFDFQLSERELSPKSIDINFDRDSVMRQYAPSSARPATTPLSSVGTWGFTDKLPPTRPGFQLSQVAVCCYHVQRKQALKRDPKIRVPAKISVMLYSVDLGLLVIGSNRGFALVDTKSNSCLHTLSSLTSILYLSDPSKFTRALRKESECALPLPKPLVRRHTTQRGLSTAAPTPMTPRFSEPVMPTLEELDDDVFDVKMMTVSELESSVTALELVQLQLEKNAPPTLMLWVGLASGHLVAYGVNTTTRKGKIDLTPTKFIQDTKSPIVAVIFLNEWGDRQLIPFQRKRTNLSGSPEERPAPTRGRAEQYAVVVSEDRVRSYSFPGFHKIESASLPQGSALLQSEHFTCNDLPCLLSVSSNKDIFIHSLPGLKLLLHLPLAPLTHTRSLCTFHVSGPGQAIFMSSDSELQRLSLVTEDKLNLPACFPDLYVNLADPEPYQGGVGKRILDALFTSGPATVDRENLFGETARRALGNLYKLDGKASSSYAGKLDNEREDRRRGEGGAAKGGAPGASGVAGQMNKNVQALHERREKLSQIEERTEQVAREASDFADMAKKLRQKYEH
ncbi:syntaxin-binding protein 5-like isoform X2 [Halichondria panicea]|uniref:syntaxin-binding protein 5-like isoform X2 n=1 Tax=Halichondria panicea TaxID=6063 RepID=UPI00312B3186